MPEFGDNLKRDFRIRDANEDNYSAVVTIEGLIFTHLGLGR